MRMMTTAMMTIIEIPLMMLAIMVTMTDMFMLAPMVIVGTSRSSQAYFLKREILAWMASSEAPKAQQASESSEEVDSMRASCCWKTY